METKPVYTVEEYQNMMQNVTAGTATPEEIAAIEDMVKNAVVELTNTIQTEQ